MDVPLVTHLTWPDGRAVEAKAAVSDLIEHPGWEFLTEALQMRESQLVTSLLSMSATDEGARYAEAVGEINSLRSVQNLVEGVLEYGFAAQERLEAEELQPA